MKNIFKANELHSIKELTIPADLRVLVLAPHPDDADAIGITLKFFLNNGNHIEVCVARTGSGVEDEYHPGATLADMADIREQEQKNSMHFLGLPDRCITFLSLINDDSDQVTANLENLEIINAIIHSKKPDIIFMPHGNDTNSAHRAMYSMFRQIIKHTELHITALLNRDPKTIEMRTDLYMPFDQEAAEWKAELLRIHDTQHQRNLNTRGYGFDKRILDYNRQIAGNLSLDTKYAEAFEIELF